MRRQHQEMEGLEFAKPQRAVENRKKKNAETGYEVICGVPTTPLAIGKGGESEELYVRVFLLSVSLFHHQYHRHLLLLGLKAPTNKTSDKSSTCL